MSKNKKQLKEKIEKLWYDSEVRAKYREGCLRKEFMTVEQYCKKLLEVYAE